MDDGKIDKSRRDLFSKGIMAGGIGAGLVAGYALTGSAQASPATVSTGLFAENFGVKPNSKAKQTRALQNAINQAASAKKPLYLPAGRINTDALALSNNSHLIGVAGNTELSFQGGGTALLTCHKAERLTLSGLVLTGNQLRVKEGLVHLSQVQTLSLSGCIINHSYKNGLALFQCGGRVSHNELHDNREAGLFSEDATGLEITHNHVHHCHNNGLQVWRRKVGHDGTMLSHNRIEHIKATQGGQGQYGNGINIFRANDVMISNNHISHCAFSAVRNNSSSNCQILNNHCMHLDEVALYVEFSFEGAIVSNNLIDTAGSGIVVTNFKEGGRLATISGNLVRNIKGRKNEKGYGSGISVEADSIVSSNVIENIRDDGIAVGWGKYVRDIVVTANLIRKTRVGIGITGEFGGGYLTVHNNMISGTKKGAIRAKDFNKYIGPDLTQRSAESYRNFAIYSNIARG